MEIIETTSEMGVSESRFDLVVGDEKVPGLLWRPEGATGPRPLVLIGHGGTQHKRVPNVLSLARRLVRHQSFAVIAIDAPGHGDRIVDQEAAEAARRNLQDRIAAGGSSGARREMTEEQAKALAERSVRGVDEWKAVLDAAADDPDIGVEAVGYWGVSMGTAIGLPFVAAEPRVKAAVLGLFGLGGRPGQKGFEAAARSLSMPVLFMFQWDDELMTRESGLALFDAIGSEDKTLTVHPGGHVGTPLYERDLYESFYVRHLGGV
jgi:pimeloyl-ACP methyl ester carboxylesterase